MKALLMNPWVWLALVAGLLFSTGAGGVLGYRLANQAAEVKYLTLEKDSKAKFSRLESGYKKKELDATTQYRALETKMAESVRDIAVQHTKEMSDAENRISSLQSDVRRGELRLSIPTKTNTGSCSASVDTTTGHDPIAEARSELSERASEFLIDFSGRCDANTRQLNAVIDAYDSIRSISNSVAATGQTSEHPRENSHD